MVGHHSLVYERTILQLAILWRKLFSLYIPSFLSFSQTSVFNPSCVPQCLQGRCPSSTHTPVPPCIHIRSTLSPLLHPRAKVSKVVPRSMEVPLTTQPPAQSSTHSTSRRQQVRTFRGKCCLRRLEYFTSAVGQYLIFRCLPVLMCSAAAAAAAQALHLANQPQQQMYSALAPTPPSMTPGPNPQSPQASFPSAQQTVYIHPQQVQHGYNPNHMAHVQQVTNLIGQEFKYGIEEIWLLFQKVSLL